MPVSVEELVEDVRMTSGLRNNRLWSDDQIAASLTDGFNDMRDKMIVGNFAGWFKDTYEFSLTNGAGNSLDLSLVPLFQMAQGLDLLNGDAPPFDVPMLDSFKSRNQGAGVWPFMIGPSFTSAAGRRYWIDGTTLTVYPNTNAQGNYRLTYTPMSLPLALPTTPPPHVVSLETGSVVAATGQWIFPAPAFNDSDIGATFTVAGATNPGNNGAHLITAIGNSTTVYTSPSGLTNETFGSGDTASIQPTNNSTRTVEATAFDQYTGAQRQWSIANAAFTASDVGAVLTADLDAPNGSYSGQYLISTVLSATSVIVESTQVGGLTLPTSGSFTIDRRQLNTVMELPQPLTPWAKYPVLYTSIAIRTSRQQDIAQLELQFQQMQARLTAQAKQRSEGIRQAPIMRGWGGWGGSWNGGGY